MSYPLRELHEKGYAEVCEAMKLEEMQCLFEHGSVSNDFGRTSYTLWANLVSGKMVLTYVGRRGEVAYYKVTEDFKRMLKYE